MNYLLEALGYFVVCSPLFFLAYYMLNVFGKVDNKKS